MTSFVKGHFLGLVIGIVLAELYFRSQGQGG